MQGQFLAVIACLLACFQACLHACFIRGLPGCLQISQMVPILLSSAQLSHSNYTVETSMSTAGALSVLTALFVSCAYTYYYAGRGRCL